MASLVSTLNIPKTSSETARVSSGNTSPAAQASDLLSRYNAVKSPSESNNTAPNGTSKIIPNLSSLNGRTIATPEASTTPEAETQAEPATPAATMHTPTTTGSNTSSTTVRTSTYTPTGIYDPANLQAYNAQREAQIRQLYANAQNSTLAGLKTAYDQNLSDATAYRDQISPQYQRSMNALSAEYERQRRNNNMQAAANGLNTGAGSQMALAQSANYQANQAGLAAKENQALDEANRRLTDLKANYQNAIAEATAQNNYKLAASLLDEYQNAYNRQMQIENTNYTREFNENEREYSRSADEAAKKAQYGDFSGYAALYGDDVANMMQLTWAMQNPQIAWASGKLSAEDYQTLTGYAPNDGTAAAASDGSGSIGGIRVGAMTGGYGSSRNSGGYSASRDRAYRGPAGYYDIYGNFVSPGNFAAGTALNSEGAGTPNAQSSAAAARVGVTGDAGRYQGTPADAGKFQVVSLSGSQSGGSPSSSNSSATAGKSGNSGAVDRYGIGK